MRAVSLLLIGIAASVAACTQDPAPDSDGPASGSTAAAPPGPSDTTAPAPSVTLQDEAIAFAWSKIWEHWTVCGDGLLSLRSDIPEHGVLPTTQELWELNNAVVAVSRAHRMSDADRLNGIEGRWTLRLDCTARRRFRLAGGSNASRSRGWSDWSSDESYYIEVERRNGVWRVGPNHGGMWVSPLSNPKGSPTFRAVSCVEVAALTRGAAQR